jgi:ATP-dependent helicase/nuclease subunit A
MQPTPEQHKAIHIHDKNLIVVAGAGSGKTRVLVERYLQLLENNADWKLNALVAITFTREAAFEMRNRVRIALEENVAKTKDDDKLSRWAQLLSEMDTARIDTIHGLCVTILRANAAQAGIDPKFEVVDEVDASILLEDIVSDILQDLDAPLTDLFSAYESVKIIESLTRANLINADFEAVPDNPDDLLNIWYEEWLETVSQAKQTLLQSDEAFQFLPEYPVGGTPPDDKLGELYIQYEDFVYDIDQESDAIIIYGLFVEFYSKSKVGNVGSASLWGGKEGKKEAADKLRAVRDLISDLLKRIGEPLNDLDQETARLLPLWYQLLMRVQTAYRDHKREHSLLDFDDLERITAQLLQDGDVRTRYRNAEFKHLLVDEFQDTNDLQWEIIQSLASLDHKGALFVVGDPKQSIYQFRGADVSVFQNVREKIANNVVGKDLPLSKSFRTHRRLVDQFNELFARILVRDEASPVKEFEVILDQPMTASREESPEQPVIECLLLDYNECDEHGEYVKSGKKNSKNRYPAETMRRWEAYELAQHINALISEKRPVFDKEKREYRDAGYGDVAILFQSMSNVNIYEGVFKSLGIPFMTVAGRGYYSRQEVWDMLDLLRTLHNPSDNLSLATALRSPMFGFSDDMLFALRLIPNENPDKRDPMPLWDALSFACENEIMGITSADLPLIEFAVSTVHDLRQMAGRVTISELMRQALARTGYLAILTGLPDGARRRGNIEKLLQLAESSGKITLGKFSQYLADLTAREIREGEALLDSQSAVKMMTVHASKGLEFPVVILADASWTRGGGGGSDTIMYDTKYGLSCQVFDNEQNKYISAFAHRRNNQMQQLKEDAERKRLLYVAATRAQDYLVISGQLTLNSKGSWSVRGWLKQLMTAFELDDLIRAIDQTCSFADDVIRVMMPPQPPPVDVLYADAQSEQNLWEYDADEADFPAIDSPPPLIDAIHVAPDAQIGHISATQLADLGGVHHGTNLEQREFFRQRFRRRTLHDAPARVQDLSADRKPNVSQRLIGEIVHEAIRFWRFDLDQRNFEEMLEGYAWQSGVTFEHELQDAVQRSQRLLNRFQQSAVFTWIESAKNDQRPLFTELPFILRTDKRVVHGVIDVLFQKADGSWVIVDYKTSNVSDNRYDSHAKRYHLQVGVYAAAVQQQLGSHIIPETYIHYIRHDKTVPVPTNAWQSELSQLERYIGELVTSDA